MCFASLERFWPIRNLIQGGKRGQVRGNKEEQVAGKVRARRAGFGALLTCGPAQSAWAASATAYHDCRMPADPPSCQIFWCGKFTHMRPSALQQMLSIYILHHLGQNHCPCKRFTKLLRTCRLSLSFFDFLKLSSPSLQRKWLY